MSLDSIESFPRPTERLGLGSLGRASIVYALGGLAYKGVALITIPILARLLSPDQLGVLDLAAVLASTVGLVAGLGMDQAVAFHEPRSDAPGRLWGAALVIALSVGGLLALIGLVLSDPISSLLTDHTGNGPVIVAAGAYGIVLGMTAIALNAVRLRSTAAAYAVASFLIVTAEMAAALAVAWLLRGPVWLMVAGWAAGALIVVLPLMWRFLPRIRAPGWPDVRGLVAFGAPLVPAAIAWLIGDAWIRGALARQVDLAALGEYGIAYRIASALGLVVTGFSVAWYPYLFRSQETEVVPRAARVLSVALLGFAAIGVALTVFSPEIIALVGGPAYADARDAIAPLVGGMVALGTFVLVAAVVGASGSTSRIGVAALAGAGIQIATSAPLVEGYGLAGAGVASLCGYVVAALLLLASEARLMAGRAGAFTAGSVAVGAVGLALGSGISGSPIAIRIGAVIAFAAFAALLAYAFGRRGGHPDLRA
jgi:O-antigen/teichoic acid export membrane protein